MARGSSISLQDAPGAPPETCDLGVQRAVAYAVQHDVVVVASAGDDGNTDNVPQWPASCAGVLAVGGVEPDGTVWVGSQRESYVDVAGPGDHVGWSGKDGKYIPDSYGTSGAAALVSGAAALMRSRYPSMSARTVVQRLINTTVQLGQPVPNDSTGYGLIDIYRALNVRGYPVAATAPNPPFTAFTQWLASPDGRQAAVPTGPPSLPPASSPAGSAGSSGAALIGIVVVVVALLLVGLVVVIALLARRTRRGKRRPSSGGPYLGQPSYPGQPPHYPGACRRVSGRCPVSRRCRVSRRCPVSRRRATWPVRLRPAARLSSRVTAARAPGLRPTSRTFPHGTPAREPGPRPAGARSPGTPASPAGLRPTRAPSARTPASEPRPRPV